MGRGEAAVRGAKRHAGATRPGRMAARWARDAYAIAPDNRDVRLLYLATMLEAGGLSRRAWTGPWTRRTRPSPRPRQFGVEDDRRSAGIRDGARASRGGRGGGPAAGPNRQGRANCSIARRRTAAAGPGRASRPTAGCALAAAGGDRASAAGASRSPARATCRRRWDSSRPAAAFAAPWSPARALTRRATWPECSPRPASRPTRSPTARNCCSRPRDRPTTNWP